MEQRLSALAKGPKFTSARIWDLQEGSRVVFPKLHVKAVGLYKAGYGNKSVSLK